MEQVIVGMGLFVGGVVALSIWQLADAVKDFTKAYVERNPVPKGQP